MGVDSGALLASVVADSSRVRGGLDLSARISEHVSAVAGGWVERELNNAKTSFGIMGRVRIKW